MTLGISIFLRGKSKLKFGRKLIFFLKNFLIYKFFDQLPQPQFFFMAYGKYRRRKRYFRLRRRFARRRFARRRFRRSHPRPELKFFTYSTNDQVGNSVGRVYSVVRALNHGTAAGEIVGSKIRLVNIAFSWVATIHSSASASRVRIMLLADHRPGALVPVMGDILETSAVNSFMNIQLGFNRWRILRNKTITLNNDSTPERAGRIYKKGTFTIGFDSSNPAVPVYNDIILALISDEPSNQPTVSTRFRCRYYDN